MKKQFDNVLKELVIRHREFFETKMAFTLIEDSQSISAVVNISNKLISIFELYPTEIIKIISEQPKLLSDLYHPELYGHLVRLSDVSPYNHMLHVLKHADENPAEALHVQMCFIYRIYDHLNLAKTNLALKQEWVEKTFNSKLFSDRARKEVSSPTHPLYKQGICRLKFFNKKIESTFMHKPAKEKFRVDVNSNFHKEAFELLMPTICGPSGHTGSLVLLAGLLNSLNEKEWQEYALVIASYLVIAGAHSFHESLMVSKTAGVKYEYGNYHSMFASKSHSVKMIELLQQHDHLLENKGGILHV